MALEELMDREVDEALQSLDDQQLDAVKACVDSILERERAGLDSLFSSMTHTMKFIPNLLLQSLTARYIEPPIAARICDKLTLKQAVAVANGLKPEYLAETNSYMASHQAAELLSGMQKKKASQTLVYAITHYPAKAIDVMVCLEKAALNALIKQHHLDQFAYEEHRDRALALFD